MKIYGPQITGSLGINGSTIGNFNNLVSTSSFNQYTSSISTGSLATTGSNTFVGTQTLSGSIIPAVTNTYDLGDDTHQFRHLYLSSGSLYINGTKVLGATGQELQITTDEGQSLKILEAGSDTITLQSADGNITLATSGNGDVILDPTSGIIALKGTTTLYSGYKIVSSDGNAIQLGDDLGITGSLTTTTGIVNGVNISSLSSSVASAIPNLNNATSSIQSFTSSINDRVTNLENKDLTVATTGSNTFIGNQIITGSMYMTGNLIVQGSSSLQNITASAVSIGTNIVKLNADSPAVRFAGLQVIDSGSSEMSASLLWDSLTNHWIYQRESGSVYGGGMLISGPRNLGALGDEVGITNNRVVMGIGGDHISSSGMWTDGNNLSIPLNLEVTGSITGSTNFNTILNKPTLVSGSSQVSFTGIIDKPTLVSGSSQITLSSTTGYGSVLNQAVLTSSSPTFAGLSVTGNINIPGTNKIVFNSEPNSWFLQVRTTTSTANLGSGLKNLFYNGGGANEGIAFSGVDTGAASMEVRNDGRVWIKENLTVGGTLTENSSLRYKENVETIKYGLDKVLQMRGVTYDKKDNGVKEMGVIAEEVYDVLPEVVLKNEEGDIDSVSYGRIVGVLIEAIKEQQKQIEELKSLIK